MKFNMTDYTINGVTYTEDTLKAEAEKRGYDFETYKSKLEKKHGENFQYDPATAETNVGSKTNMVSNSDPGSLDLSKMNKPKPLKDKIDPFKKPDIKIETYNVDESAVYKKSNLTPEQYFDIETDKDYKPIFSKTGRIVNKPKTRKLDANEMENILDTTKGVYKNILLSPKNFDLPFSSQSENASYQYSAEELNEIQEAAYENVVKKTGLKITKQDFVKLYSVDNFSLLQDTVATSQKINNARLALANDTLDTKFKDEQVNIFYNSKSNKEQAKINEVAKIRDAQKNITKTQSQINSLNQEDENYNSKLEALNIQLDQQEAIIKESNELIERNATTTTSVMSAGGVPQQVTNVDQSLKSAFLKKGYTQSSIDRILQAKNTVKATSAAGVNAIKNSNPDLTDEEALVQYFDSQVLRKQNLIKENSEKIIPFNFQKLTVPTELERKLNSIGVFANDKGVTEATASQLKELGFSSRNFEGFFDSKIWNDVISKEDLNYLKASEQSLDDVDGDLLGLYDMIYQNTDPAALKKPGFIKNIAQNAVIATAMEFGASPEEAENLSTLGQGKRNRFMLDRIDEVTREYNTANPSDAVQFTDEQKENIERTFMEEVEEGTGQMVPIIGKIIGLTTLTGGAMNIIKGSKWMAQALKNGTGYENLMAKILQSKGMSLAIEEANMQLVGFEPGTGLSFGVGRMLAKPITLSKITGGRLPALNPLFEKVPKAGVIGALSSELATVVGLGYEDLMDNKDFSNEFDALYGDLRETTRRLLVNSMVFGIAGVGSVKKTDLMSTGAKLSAIKDIEIKKQELLGKDLIQSTSPDGKVFARQKTKEDLNPADKKKYEALESAQINLEKLYLNEAFEGNLDVNSPEFETNFNKRFTQPLTKAIQSVIPEYKGFNVKFGSGKKFRKQYFEKDSQGNDTNNSAEWHPETNTVYFDKAKYNAGKPLHEFTHIALDAYFTKNPTAKKNFLTKMQVLFKDFEFPVDSLLGQKYINEITGELERGNQMVTGKEIIDVIDKKYKGDKEKKAEEFLAFMSEYLTNPDAYYSRVAPNFIKEIIADIKDILVETGVSKFAPKPTNAKEFVENLTAIGNAFRRGTKLEVKASTLAKLEEIDFSGIEYVDTKKAVETVKKERKASKDLFQQTDKTYRENKELWVDKEANKTKRDRVIGEMAYKWQNEIDRKFPKLENFSKKEVENIVLEFVTAEKRGLRDLMDKFDQEKLLDKDGKPYESISAYLNTPGIIQKRLIEFYKNNPNFNKIRKSLEDESVKELTNVKKDVKVETAFKDKKGKLNVSERFNIEKEVDAVIDKLSANELTATNYKNTINRVEKIIEEKFTPQFMSRPANAKTIHDAFPKSIMPDGKATGVRRALIKAFYSKSDLRGNAKLGKSKDGLNPQIKQPFNLETFIDFVNRRTLSDGKLERINDQLNPRLDAVKQEFGKAATNQAKAKILKKEFKNNPFLQTALEFVTGGKSDILASKDLFADGKKKITPVELKKYAEAISLLEKDPSKAAKKYPDQVSKLAEIIEKAQQEFVKSNKNPSFDSMVKEIPDFIQTPFGKISKTDIFDGVVGKGMFGQKGETKVTINKDGKKVKKREKLYEWYDTARIENFLEGKNGIYGKEGLATFYPKWLTEVLGTGDTLLQSFGIGTRASGMNVLSFKDSRSKTPKYEKDTTLEATYLLPKNQKDKLINALGKGKNKTDLLDNLRDAVFTSETVQKKSVLDSWDKMSEKEKIETLKKKINPTDNQQKADLYFALEGIKQQWLYSSKNKEQFIERSKTLFNLASKNSNLVKGYNRMFVPITAVLYKPGMSIRQMKLEHVKSSLEQSMQATTAILEGRWLKDGKKIMNDFNGIISTKDYLTEIDNFGGTTNTAGIARMTANFENLKNYRTVESGFKETLYDAIIIKTAQKIGAKTRELGINYLQNQLTRYVVEPTPTNEVILKQALNNKKDAKEVFDNNNKLAKKAGVKQSNNAEIIVELTKKDKENAKKIKERFASKDLSKEFNDILEQSSGVESVKEFSDIRAKTIGKNKRKWQLFIPDSAADLNGLIDVTLGKGKKGNAQRKWYKENIIDPFNKAEDALVRDRVALTSGFKALKKQLKVVPKDLRKEAIEGFTFEQAIRVHTWNKQGMKVEGLSKRDLKELSEIIEKNPELNAFSEQLIELGKGEGYPSPPKDWLAGSISTDLRTGLNRGGRAKYLEATGYTENIGKIYSKENLNKLEALYGSKYRVALENMLGRMKTGINRKPSANALENRALDWINNANGVTMFLNARSAVLQTISSLNYINWTDNNPLKAGKALANQPQYWKDFMEIMNSDYLVDRRNGLKLNVSESEIADAAKSSTNSARGAINYLLSKGFLFTRIADSFAIASGGSTFYRNRINTYKKQGLSEAQAKEKAFKDFREISEVSQQSANVSKISMEQSSTLGRLVLAFANTPMQYARLQKSAILDLANGRGDYKTNFSKVMYYGFVQNLMFNALQNALFTNIWEDNPDPVKENMKKARIANGMADSILRGMGIGGAGISTIKNVMLKVRSESQKSRPDYNKAASEVFDFIPPIDTKIRKLRATALTFKYDSDKMKQMSMMDIDNPAYLAGANVISAATNFPADRIIRKTQNMKGVLTDEMEMWQRIARFAGWSEWEIGPQQEKKTKGKSLLKLPKLKLPKLKL